MTTKIAGHDVVSNGQATKAGERLMELCHEAAGMGCWHKLGEQIDSDFRNGLWNYKCSKCDFDFWIEGMIPDCWELPNPAYLTSLDAYNTIWKKLRLQTVQEYWDILVREVTKYGKKPHPLLAQPHHHLEALARVLTVKCEECKGDYAESDPAYCTHESTCPHCNKGTITVLEQWLAEIEEGV